MRKVVYIQRMESKNAEQHNINNISLGPGLTKEQAERIFVLGKDAVVFALLQLAKMAAEYNANKLPVGSPDDPSCPSGQKPVFVKPNKNDKQRSKKPGRKKGHEGNRRDKPDKVDRVEEHRISQCPDCGTKVKKCNGSRERYVEDILEDYCHARNKSVLFIYCVIWSVYGNPKTAVAIGRSSVKSSNG